MVEAGIIFGILASLALTVLAFLFSGMKRGEVLVVLSMGIGSAIVAISYGYLTGAPAAAMLVSAVVVFLVVTFSISVTRA